LPREPLGDPDDRGGVQAGGIGKQLAEIRDLNIRRAYRYLHGNRDDQMAMTLAIRTSVESGMTRSVLQGFLCARDISLEGIASLLGLEADVVRLYAGLFFNVRNREGSYALNTIFPQTRLAAR